MTCRVLYVDDEPDIREIAVMSLELDPGFEVRSAGSGAEALAIAQDWDPHIVLLDVQMPGMDGPTTLRHLWDIKGEGLRVAFVTARAQVQETESYLALGAIGVIPKPFDPMTLAEDVKRLTRVG